MDQTKNQGQDAQRQGNQGQGGGQQGNKPQGNPGQGGQQNWNQGGGGQQNQNRNPNPTQGRDKVRGEEERGQGSQGEPNRERGQGSQGEQNRERGLDRNSGITNRGSDREMSEQSDLPERGQSRSDRSGSNR
jgi:hypothetical protein